MSVKQGYVRFQQQESARQANPQTSDLTVNEHLLVKNDGLTSLDKVEAADASVWRIGWLLFNNALLE